MRFPHMYCCRSARNGVDFQMASMLACGCGVKRGRKREPYSYTHTYLHAREGYDDEAVQRDQRTVSLGFQLFRHPSCQPLRCKRRVRRCRRRRPTRPHAPPHTSLFNSNTRTHIHTHIVLFRTCPPGNLVTNPLCIGCECSPRARIFHIPTAFSYSITINRV